jgi:hypothetical protein
MDHRLNRSWSCYRVGVTMKHLPAVVLAPEDRRDAKGHTHRLGGAAQPHPVMLDLDDGREIAAAYPEIRSTAITSPSLS